MKSKYIHLEQFLDHINAQQVLIIIISTKSLTGKGQHMQYTYANSRIFVQNLHITSEYKRQQIRTKTPVI